HVLFEYSAESYRASDGFCNMMGKNCWLYQQIDSTGYSDLVFKDPYWTGNGKTEVGYFHMTAGTKGAVRKWVAPHDGKVHLESVVRLYEGSTGVPLVEIRKNNKPIWPVKQVVAGKSFAPNFTLTVKKGDTIEFIEKSKTPDADAKVYWDPAITYL
ncbi:MAG: hypothetical protein PHY99_10715, partial [Bacteroidales bacterium]|nr:hypothetical protein [Bacteroidales bacterium]